MTTSRVITQPKDTADVPLKRMSYVKVAESVFPAAGAVHAMLYANLDLRLTPGKETGRIRVKGRRRGTTDDTAYRDITVHADNDDGAEFQWLVTEEWFGKRPSGGVLDWYISLGYNVVSGRANAGDTDYGKGLNN